MPPQHVKHGAGSRFTRVLPRHRAELRGIDLDRPEHQVHDAGDQVRTAGEVRIQRRGPRIQPLRKRSHRQGIGPLIVDYLQRRRDDPVQRDGRSAGGASLLPWQVRHVAMPGGHRVSMATLDNVRNNGNTVSNINRRGRFTMLLPLATEPFTVPTDRDMLPSERRAFVRTHRTCAYGYRRLHDGDAMSIVYYIPTDDDELLVSTMAPRGKAKAVARDGKVSLCVLDERWPFVYLQVYGDAVIDRDHDLVGDVMMAVAGRMSGQPLGDDARPYVAQMADKEDRVVVRCR